MEDEAKICQLEDSESWDLYLGSVTLALWGLPSPTYPSQGEQPPQTTHPLGYDSRKFSCLKGIVKEGRGKGGCLHVSITGKIIENINIFTPVGAHLSSKPLAARTRRRRLPTLPRRRYSSRLNSPNFLKFETCNFLSHVLSAIQILELLFQCHSSDTRQPNRVYIAGYGSINHM